MTAIGIAVCGPASYHARIGNNRRCRNRIRRIRIRNHRSIDRCRVCYYLFDDRQQAGQSGRGGILDVERRRRSGGIGGPVVVVVVIQPIESRDQQRVVAAAAEQR
jgi:hypothetical protein